MVQCSHGDIHNNVCTPRAGPTCLGQAGEKNETQVNYDTCVTYLEDARDAKDTGGFEALEKTVFTQYLEHPSGPYLTCHYTNNSTDFRQLTRLIHPYNPRGVSMGDRYDQMEGQEADTYRESQERLVRTSRENKDSETLFLQWYPNNQTAAQEAGKYVSGDRREYVMLSFGLNDTEYEADLFLCGCPYTGIPEGDRNNTNAVVFFDTRGGEESSGDPLSPGNVVVSWGLAASVVLCASLGVI